VNRNTIADRWPRRAAARSGAPDFELTWTGVK
jgi:hypothetical protein